jgi:hypothetical protein
MSVRMDCGGEEREAALTSAVGMCFIFSLES